MRKIKAYLYSFVFAASLLCGYGKTKAADAASVDEEIIASVTDAEPDSDSDSEAEAGDNADIREQTNYRENYGHIDVDFDIVSSDDSDDSYEDFLVYASYIPSSYDSRDYGYVTSVKNQGSYGTCWAFSALSAGESSLLSQDIMTDVDLSEAHFIYFLYNNVDDPLGNLGEDKNIITDSSTDFMEIGGSDLYNMFALSSWKRAADESGAPYDYANPLMSLDKSLAYEDIAHLQNVNIVSMEDSDKVKSLIMKYGAVSCGMYLQNNIYYNSINKAFYQNTSSSSNHDVNIIGWDDTYSRDNFSSYKRPSSDGAWLIKNSWGTSMDYIWVSYEDSVLSESTAFAFIFESADNYDYNYQYDGSSSAKYLNVSNGTTFANVYEIKGSEAERLSVGSALSRLMSPRVNAPETFVPWVSVSRFCPSIKNSTRSTLSNSVSVCTMALIMLLSAAASAMSSTSLLRSMRARPFEMYRSIRVFSGSTVRSPSRAACISLPTLCTIMFSVALAMPSSMGTEHITGTR